MGKLLLFTLLCMFAPDGGGAEGGGSPAPPASQEGGAAPTPPADASPAAPTDPPAATDGGTDIADLAGKADPPELPKWSSQLSPAKRESEGYLKHAYNHKSIEELADAYVDLVGKQGRSLEIPGQDAGPEEIKAFLTKLGLPDDEQGYDLPNRHNDTSSLYEGLEKEMRSQFYRNGLTKRQASSIWEMITEGYHQSGKIMDAYRAQQVQTFDARLSNALEPNYPVKAERDTAANETMTLFAQHVKRTGLGKAYKDTGLLYDPSFVLAIANDEKARSGSSIVKGSGGPAREESQGAFGSNYSSDFKKAYGN